MLVYGDHCERTDASERLVEIGERLDAVRAMPSGIERHAQLVAALIEAGRVQQGIADAAGDDAPVGEFVAGLARAIVQSWDSAFGQVGELPTLPLVATQSVDLRLPEGFAFYALYPEAYAEAARKLRLRAAPRVIGIRSIGTTLGAIVAAALDAPRATTVRPFGDPFARQVELPNDLTDDDAHFVIVDEGPGLSGSSFGCVADELQRRGVPLERIAFLPSHAGELGPEASEEHRDRWSKAQRVAAQFKPIFLEERFGPLESFSTGHPFESLKFLGTHEGSRVLLKFAGLGATGERKLAMARALHAARLTVEPLALVHGFLVERWCGEARALRADEKPVEQIGRYIGARARMFPAEDANGASIGDLIEMCRRNIELAFGQPATLARWSEQALSRAMRRVRTDNKLDRGEWLRSPDGRLLKYDALDHHQAHDLIGCQDAAWDIAGAIVEFELDASDRGRLIMSSGCTVDADLLQFYQFAYCAFRLGRAHLAAAAGGSSHRLQHDVDRYRRATIDLFINMTAEGLGGIP